MAASRAFALAAALAVAIGCGGGSPTSASSTGSAPVVTAHFMFAASVADSALAQHYATALEQEFARITTDLGVASMPRVLVNLYATHAQLEAAVAPLVGAIPAWASGLATSADQIHVVSQIGSTNLVHEFAHCVSMQINPRIGNNPRWFWESVAIYEAGQRVDPKTLPYMTAGTPPTFTMLNGFDNTLIYDVGYTIGEFVVARGGVPALRRLIGNNADVAATLGLSLSDFERGWFTFTRQSYGF